MRVGYVITVHFTGVIRYTVLRDGIVDLLSVPVLGQVQEAPLPPVRFRDSSRLHLNAVRLQTDRNTLRTYTVLVVVVLPGLAAFHRNGFRRVRICDREACLSASADRDCISTRSVRTGHGLRVILFHGIDDLLAALLFIQIPESPCPAVSSVQRQYSGSLYTVCQKFDGDCIRTDSVLIAFVIPDLRHSDLCLARCMGVGYIKAAHFTGVVLYVVLRDGIVDLLSVVVLRKVLKRPLPVILFRDSRRFHFCAVRLQTNRDALRTYAVLVIIILPGLAAFYGQYFRCMNVRDRESLPGTSFHCEGVSACSVLSGDDFILLFLYGIDDLLPVLLLIQIREGTRPAVLLCQNQTLSGLLSIREQKHDNRRRADTILIICILPDLHDRHLRLFRRVGVGNIKVFHFGSIILHAVFRDGVYNLFSVCIFRQIRKVPFPSVCLGNYGGSNFCAVRSQTDRDALRTDAVLVVVILPGLASCNCGLLRRMDVGNREASPGASADGDRIGARTIRPGHDLRVILFHGIDDLFAALLFIQVPESSGPVIPFVQDQHSGSLYTV